MIRFFDILFSILGLSLVWPVMVVVFLASLLDTGAPLVLQQRVGRHQQPFTLLKFRTMRLDAPTIATHLIDASVVTRLGCFLRRTKLDELPQLWNVLKGDMSFVGPRPSLPTQRELIDERESRGIYEVRPGVTGLAQIRGIDMSTPRLLAETDRKMLRKMTLSNYFKYLIMTALGRGAGDRIESK
jgi:O-antigen biosynthesis protein WbqP